MISRSPAQAVQDFIAPQQRMISCVSNAILLHNGDYRPGVVQHVRLSQEPAQLDGETRLSLRVLLQFEIVSGRERRGLWEINPISYRYEYFDRNQKELLAYHLHTRGRSHVTYAHLHLGPALAIPSSPAADAHLPTGIISLPDVLRLAIAELGVAPRREDWQRVLDESHSAS